MTKKIRLTRDGYGGLPYPAGSVLEIGDDEGAFITNSGAAIYVDPLTEVTPVPEAPVLAAAAKLATDAEKAKLDAMLPSERHKLEEAKKKAEEDRKWKEEDDKAKAEAAKKLEAARKAEEDKIKVSSGPHVEPHKEAAHAKK